MGVFSINLPYDVVPPGQTAYGAQTAVADPREGEWGTVTFYDCWCLIPNVPAGKRVQLKKFSGDAYGFSRGAVAYVIDKDPGRCAVLVGIITDTKPPAVAGQIQYFGPQVNADGSLNWGTPLCNNQIAPEAPGTAAQSGCAMFKCEAMTAGGTFRIPICEDLSGTAPLDSNNAFVMRQSTFLNDTGLPVHMEFTGVIEYEFV
jgi:hypothetical protein